MIPWFLDIEYKKGDPRSLDGRLTAYAIIDIDPAEMLTLRHPIASAVHNGFLSAQGNYRDQNNLRDFLRSEMGLSLEEGLEEIIERLDGLESALDPQKLREKIDGMKEFEDFIPTPAKIVPFQTEAEILAQEGDVFFMGRFKHIGNANLSVNSFPILYQARYREQQISKVRNEIEQLISQIEKIEPPNEPAARSDSQAEIGNKLLKEYIPEMLYSRKEADVFDTAKKRFRKFMEGYAFQDDVEAIVKIIGGPSDLTANDFRLLELYAKKIAEVRSENYTEVDRIRSDIRKLETSM